VNTTTVFLWEFERGERVRLRDGIPGPKCRVGNVEEIRPQNGGYLVRHDEPEDMGVFGMVDLFGWAEHELEAVMKLVPCAETS
jgi:hypothetical protein